MRVLFLTVWLVRAGKFGEREDIALNNNLAAIGWVEMPDMSNIKSRDELRDLYQKTYPDKKKNAASNQIGQICALIKRIKPGDRVVMPSKAKASISIGEATGPYKYRTDLPENSRHTIPVNWIKTDIPRTAFDQDLLYSLGAFMTVCQIKRNNAEIRIKKILQGKTTGGNGNGEGQEPDEFDIEQAARDQITNHVKIHFKGHELSRLVEAVLQAQGYVTENAKPGPDGGVDILAGTGPMGFGEPKMCVQVKSSESPVDVTVLRGLKGSMTNFGAQQGLLVSWGGFTRAVLEEARKSFFNVRLWDSDDLIKSILKNYDDLSDSFQAELPLKRIWALVVEEE